LEAEVHEYFAEQRVVSNREMFAVNSITAQQVIETLGEKYSTVLRADSSTKYAFKDV
jgi:hypothetical protein